MKLFLKRDLSASDTEFVFFDESGNEKYLSKHKKTKVTSKLNIIIYDATGSKVARIRQLPIVATSTFVLKVNKSHMTFVVVPTTKGIYSYFYGKNWHINGDIAAKNFTVIDVDKSVVFSHRQKSRYCELEFSDAANELYCAATSICANLINTVGKSAVKAVNI